MITQFTIGTSRTINLGNFESLRIEASITVAVPEDCNFQTMKREAQEQLRLLMEETFKAQDPKRQAEKRTV